jgi:serine/threonine protein kinase
MAEIIGGGEPVNDSERAAIRHLRDHGPADWFFWHNIDVPLQGGRKGDIDILLVTTHAVTLIDVKGTHGRIEVAGRRWYPSNRQSFFSPVDKLRNHARAFKGHLTSRGLNSRIFVNEVVVLTAPDARLVDGSTSPDADALHVITGLADLIPELSKPERVRTGFLRDIRRYRNQLIRAIDGTVLPRTGPLRFGHWEVTESLGETEEVTEYRARNANARTDSSVLLRVYHADPFQPEDVRGAERIALSNAYDMLVRLPSDKCVVGCRDFFPNEDESQYVLVLEDVRASALLLHLTDPQLALTADEKLRVIRDMLHGLAHAHAHRVLHRALSPTTVLVTGTSGGMLTGFDYARPEDPRSPSQSVFNRLAETLDPAYVAPECQNQPQRMSKASDVYAAGVIAFYVLTGELPFATTTDQHQRSSVLPSGPMAAAGLAQPLIDLLRRMCAREPDARPSAAEAQEAFAAAAMTRPPVRPERQADYRNLPEGYQLTTKFTVQRRIGGGSFGVVYQVYDNLAGADRAVKIVDRDRVSPVGRLQQEYHILLSLPPHPNVVKVEYADYLEGSVPYLVFEYLDGKDVNDLARGRVLGPADTIRLGVEAATGLAFLHDNDVYHCDIKPSNLLWTDRGCKIIDFNVAVLSSSSMSRAGGSTRYAPPDVSSAAPPSAADLADRDVYGLGVTLYQVLTGRYPFASGRPTLGERAADPQSSSELSELSDQVTGTLLRAIAPLRGDRFGSAVEFLRALGSIGEVHRRPAPTPTVSHVPIPAALNVNPFVAHLQSLYSQSPVSNAGTRGEDAYGTYVATALDEHLIPDVLDGTYRLVVITGNAGDGKTAFLERLTMAAAEDGGQRGEPRANGTDVRLPGGRLLYTNNDGSQDEGDRGNDEVLTEFFRPFADDAAADRSETRLIAINEGRLVDFITTREDQFTALPGIVRKGLAGEPPAGDIAVVNLNLRSLVADDGARPPVFDRVLAQLTHERFWAACEGCELARTCYAPHNARTFAHPSAGPKITKRLREVYRLVHLRGQLHITLRDLRSALAFMLTSGRDCAQIHELYRTGNAEEILPSFYFNSWIGTPDTADRLLRLLRELDVAAGPEPSLDGKLAALGPTAGHGMMTIDRRGNYDAELLAALFTQLRQGEPAPPGETSPAIRYLEAARRRFYFECIDDERARSALPFRSAERFLEWLASPDELDVRLHEVVGAINRGEGLPDPALADGGLALSTRDVPGGTIRSYRVFPRDSLALTVTGPRANRYVEGEPDSLELTAKGPSGHVARLRIRLDLFELLQHQRDGYLPSIAELQGRYLDLVIFKNELSATPYQKVVLTTGKQHAHQIRRERYGRLIMTPLAAEEDGDDDEA